MRACVCVRVCVCVLVLGCPLMFFASFPLALDLWTMPNGVAIMVHSNQGANLRAQIGVAILARSNQGATVVGIARCLTGTPLFSEILSRALKDLDEPPLRDLAPPLWGS